MRRRPEGFEIALLTAPPRLAEAGRLVWAALPPAIQIVLTRHWRPLAWPILESVVNLAIGDQRILACYDVDGARLMVDRDAVAWLPLAALEAIVAHEIAHAVQSAGDRAPDEAEAAALAGSWGFPLTWTAECEAVRAAWSRRRPAAGDRTTGGRVTACRGAATRASSPRRPPVPCVGPVGQDEPDLAPGPRRGGVVYTCTGEGRIAVDAETPAPQVFIDCTLVCVQCGTAFPWSAGEQGFYALKQLSPPKRCPACRLAKKARWNDERDR